MTCFKNCDIVHTATLRFHAPIVVLGLRLSVALYPPCGFYLVVYKSSYSHHFGDFEDGSVRGRVHEIGVGVEAS